MNVSPDAFFLWFISNVAGPRHAEAATAWDHVSQASSCGLRPLSWVGLLAPLLWKLARIGGLRDGGAQWATSTALRRAGLLVAEGVAAGWEARFASTASRSRLGNGIWVVIEMLRLVEKGILRSS